jgi:hypothetical protein
MNWCEQTKSPIWNYNMNSTLFFFWVKIRLESQNFYMLLSPVTRQEKTFKWVKQQKIYKNLFLLSLAEFLNFKLEYFVGIYTLSPSTWPLLSGSKIEILHWKTYRRWFMVCQWVISNEITDGFINGKRVSNKKKLLALIRRYFHRWIWHIIDKRSYVIPLMIFLLNNTNKIKLSVIKQWHNNICSNSFSTLEYIDWLNPSVSHQ